MLGAGLDRRVRGGAERAEDVHVPRDLQAPVEGQANLPRVVAAAGHQRPIAVEAHDGACELTGVGGFDVPPVLGSRSTDRLSGLGPPALADGQVLPVGPGRRPHPLDVPRVAAADGVLRVAAGPREDPRRPRAQRLTRADRTVVYRRIGAGVRVRWIGHDR